VKARRVANLSACFGDMQGLEFNIEYAGIACRLPISTAGHAAQARERVFADTRDGLERFIRQKKRSTIIEERCCLNRDHLIII
jgi:hypothetical protein